MKIVDAQIQTERTSLKRPFKTAVRTAFDIQSLIVKITLENGITGYGSGVATEKVTGDSLFWYEKYIGTTAFSKHTWERDPKILPKMK